MTWVFCGLLVSVVVGRDQMELRRRAGASKGWSGQGRALGDGMEFKISPPHPQAASWSVAQIGEGVRLVGLVSREKRGASPQESRRAERLWAVTSDTLSPMSCWASWDHSGSPGSLASSPGIYYGRLWQLSSMGTLLLPLLWRLGL